MKWTGTLTSIVGSFAVATGFYLIGYILFLIGSTAWTIVGLKSRDNALILLNVVFMTANTIGLCRAII